MDFVSADFFGRCNLQSDIFRETSLFSRRAMVIVGYLLVARQPRPSCSVRRNFALEIAAGRGQYRRAVSVGSSFRTTTPSGMRSVPADGSTLRISILRC